MNDAENWQAQDEIVFLNVGGRIYTTSKSTLTTFPNSMLGAMFGGNIPTRTDTEGNVVIDRDGETFRYILNFLRTGNLRLPDDFKEIDMLEDEADFYQIPDLITAIREFRRRQEGQRFVYEYVEVEETCGKVRIMAPPRLWRCVPTLRKEVNKTRKYRLRVWDYHTALYHCTSNGNLPDLNDVGRMKLFQQLSYQGFELSLTSSGHSGNLSSGIETVNKWIFRRPYRHLNNLIDVNTAGL
ncbi:potassium channel regulatory protein-like [Ptychodera flava]|uniref:potassium channel regulatory protein-like n=1 Tax=Ptychodera flava TaxID=63121 RepID=UPI00396A9D71